MSVLEVLQRSDSADRIIIPQRDMDKTPVEFLAPRGDKETVTHVRTWLGSMKYTHEEMLHPIGGLSGGQKQRISIARAFAKENPILIMDDSTSALDMETEQMIQQTLRTLEGTTKLIIAHRISAVRHADEIIFLENGSIAERGTHEELLAQKGLYSETYLAQYGETL